MSIIGKSGCERAFDEALRDAESWTYRTSAGFDVGDSVASVRKAYRLGDVRDVYVEREDFEDRILGIYKGVEVGTVSRVIAGTGVGKSTKMPISISLAIECVSFVVCPTHAMAGSLANYVAGYIVGTKFEACQVSLIKTYNAFTKLVKPAVAYIGANEFLALLAMHQGLFQERSVGFVYLDESHERIPAYAVCRLLVSLNFFRDTKVFMGSATASNQNMESRTEGIKQVVKSIKPELMQYDNIQYMSTKSPLHFTCLALRTLIFVPTEKQFAMLFDYYESNAVHVRLLKHSARYADIIELNTFLDTVKYTVVVLATPTHQTGYTFSIDAVIDCGVTPYLNIDLNNGDVEKQERIVTEFEKVQRAGRCGRFADGVAYQVDAEPADESFELYSGSEIYVVLWCKVFSIDVSIVYLKKWTMMLKHLSVTCAKNLLCSRLHPTIMLHYMDSDGRAYAGTRHMFSKLLGRTEAVMSSNNKLSDDAMINWVTKAMTEDVITELVGDYKSPCQMPVDWQPIACVMYHALTGTSVTALFNDGKIQRRDFSGVSDSGSAVSYALSASSAGSAGSGGLLDPRVFALRPGYRRSGDITPEDSISAVAQPELVDARVRDRSASQGSAGSGRFSTRDVNSRSNDSKRVSVSNSASSRDSGARPVSSGRDSYGARDSDSRRRSTADSFNSRGSRNDLGDSIATLKVDKDQVQNVVGNVFDKELKKMNNVLSDIRRSSVPSSPIQPPPAYAPRMLIAVERVKIKAMDLLFERIKPYKTEYMDKYRTMRVAHGYEAMYDRLVNRDINIANLPKESMIEYFLATVVMWNTHVSNLYQFRAAPHTGLFASARNKSTIENYETKINTCRGMLVVFYRHGFRLAIYQGSEQSGITVTTPDLLRAQSIAQYAQRIGNMDAVDAIERAKYCVRMSNEFGGVSGHYFVDGNIMLLVKHVFNEVDGDGTYMIFPRTDVASMRTLNDQRVYKCKLTISAMVRLEYRLPILGESVMVVAYMQRDVPDVFGVYTVTSVGGSGVYNAMLADGMSGAPLVALSDGCVVGLHHGKYVDGENYGLSEFALVI